MRQVLEQVGLQNVADRKVKKLSGGMVRRLGVAQALVHEPRVLVVDEPTVGLDPQERLRFRQLMASLGQDRTIVLSTHIVADLGSSCSDLALIDDGKIVFRGSPAELVENAPRQGLRGGRRRRRREAQLIAELRGRLPHAGGRRTDDPRRQRRRQRSPKGRAAVEDPTLEEAYLAFMAARGRAEAALVEEEAQ